MLPIHLAIGVVEGLVTAAVVLFVHNAEPELLARSAARKPLGGLRLKPVLIGLAVAALVAGGALSWFASANPDGLEWSIAKVTGTEELKADSDTHDAAAQAQEKTAVLPDYGLKGDGGGSTGGGESGAGAAAGTSLSGIVGALIVLGVAGGLGFALRRRSAARASARP